VIALYYYGEVTMKQIGAEIGVNESRVSQLHARAIRRLRDALGEMNPQHVAEMKKALVAFAAKKPMAKVAAPAPVIEERQVAQAGQVGQDRQIAQVGQPSVERKPAGVVLQYKPASKRRQAPRQPLKVARARHAVAAAR